MSGRRGRVVVAAWLALLAAPCIADAQPLTERTYNLEGTWITAPHDLFFQFSHRFQIAGTDADIGDLFGDGKVVNYPTFGLSYGLFPNAMLGVRYSSNSLIAGQANEWQPYVKLTPIRGAAGGRLSASLLAGWNTANASADAELSAQGDLGPLTLIAAARAFSDPFDRPPEAAEAELAFAGGAALRLNRYLSFAADYANMVTQDDAQIGWSAGLSLEIPYTPHTFGLFATNVTSGTLEGLSVGVDGTTFWGFEFTIRLSGHRWGRIFDPDDGAPRAPGGDAAGAEAGADPGDTRPGPIVEVEIAGMSYGTPELRIAPGTTVRWTNNDPVVHTVTPDRGDWGSRDLAPGEGYEFTFRDPGRYAYHCTPHPFMKATVIVEAAGRP